jgi:hypothetical protein
VDKSSFSPHILAIIFVVLWVIDDSHSDWSEVKSQFFKFFLKFIFTYSVWVNVVLICIFMVKDDEHFLIYLLVIYTSSFQNCLLSSFAHLFDWLLILCKVTVWVPCIFWLLFPSLDVELAKIFFQSAVCPFSLLTSFPVQKLFSFMQSHLSILSFNYWATRVLVIISLPMPMCSNVFLILSCNSFKVLVLTERFLIHFELILVQGERWGSNVNLLWVDVQFSQHHLLKKLSFL